MREESAAEDYAGGYTHLSADPAVPRAISTFRPMGILGDLSETQRQVILFVTGAVVGFGAGWFVATRRR